MMDFTELASGDEKTAKEDVERGLHGESDDSGSSDGEKAKSQVSALTASTMFQRITPWLEKEQPLLPHQEAAILLEYARDGQDLNGSKLTLRSRLCYRLRHKFQWLFRIAAWGLVIVHIFERPTWTYADESIDRWSDGNVYPSFNLPYLNPIAATTLNCVFLSVLWFGVLLEFGYKLGTSYSYLPYISATILALKSAAELVVIIKQGLHLHPTFSVSPIEAFLCLLVELQYDNNIGYVLRTLPKFAILMLTLTCFVCIYTALGLLIFDPAEQQVQLYFNTYGIAVWNMLMVLNTSNWPGPIVPAFNYNRIYCMYFYIYIMIMAWGLLNLVLGFNYLFFQQEQRGILEMQEATRVDNKAAAFRLMDVEKKGFLTYAQADDLLKEMYEFYEEMSDIPTTAERYELILVLDIQSNLMIDENDFSYIEQKCFQGALRQMRSKKRRFTRYVSANIIRRQAEIMQKNRPTARATGVGTGSGAAAPNALLSRIHENSVVEHASHYAGNIADPKLLDLYRSIETKQYLAMSSKRRPTVSQWLAHYAMQVDSIYFDILTDSVIFTLGIVLLLNSRVLGLIASYIALSLLEMVLKFQVKGLYRYMVSNRNMIDGLIAVVLLIVAIIQASADTSKDQVTHVITKTLVLLRTLLYPRNILVTNGFKKFRGRHRQAFKYAFQSASHFSFLLLLMLVLIYVFAGIGQDAFGGGICRACRTTTHVEASLYGQLDYWPLNFNDMPSGMVTMFTLLSVNNMHVTASGFVAAYSQWAEVFFACWYALGVLLLLNVLTAVFLDQFTGYMSRLASERHEAEERKRRESADRVAVAEKHEEEAAPPPAVANEEAPEGHVGSHKDQTPGTEGVVFSSFKKSSSTSVLYMLLDELSPATNSLSDDLRPFKHKTTTEAPGADGTAGEGQSSVHTPVRRAPRRRAASVDGDRMRSPDKRASAAATVVNNLGLFAKMLKVEDSMPFDDALQPSPYDGERVRLHSLDSLDSHDSDEDAHISVRRQSLAEERARSISMGAEKHRTDSDEHEHTADGLNRPRPRQDSARGRTKSGEDHTPAAQDHRTSIFASPSDRKKLNEWVASQLVRSNRKSTTGNSPTRYDAEPSPFTPLRARDVLLPRSRGASVEVQKLPIDWATELGYTEEIPHHPDVQRSVVTTTTNNNDGGVSLSTSVAAEETPEVSPEPNVVGVVGVVDNLSIEEGIGQAPAPDTAEVLSLPEKVKVAQEPWWQAWLGSRELTLIERAAVLILFAKEGHERSVFITQRARWTFQVRTAWTPLFKIAAWVFALLKFFQRPVWTYYHDRWDESAVYPRSGMPQVSSAIIGAIKLPLLLVLLFGLSLELVYNEFKWGEFYVNLTRMRVGRYTLFCYGIAQLIMICYSLGGGPPQLVPITSVGSILYVLWFNRRAMYKLQVVLKVIPSLSAVLLTSLAFVLAYAGLGRYLYNTENIGADDDLNQEYFGTFGSASWSVFVAITTSNYPNQIMPAYRDDRTFFLYFFTFIVIGAFVVLNIILVIVFVEFQKSAQLATDVERASRQVLLIRAYEVLDPHGVGYIEREQVKLLLDELYHYYADFADLGDTNDPMRSILVDILDVDYDGKITVQDFLYFLEISRIQLTAADTDKESLFERYCPGVFQEALAPVIKFKYSSALCDCVIVALIIARLVVGRDDLYTETTETVALSATAVALMLAETLVKILVRGVKSYFKNFRSMVDCVFATAAFIGLVGAGSYKGFENVNGFTYLLRIALMARLFLFPRIIRHAFEKSRERRFNRLVRRILAQTATIGVVFLCITYMFASIGLYSFGGAINKSPISNPHYDDLMNSRYAASDYFGFNFNDFMSGWFTLFSCLHVSDFDLIVSGFTSTVNQAAKLYFILWYIAGVLLMLNILKSFFLGEFLSLFLAPDGDAESVRNDDKGDDVRSASGAPSSSSIPASDEQSHSDSGSINTTGALKTSKSSSAKKAPKVKRLLSWSDAVGNSGDSSAQDSSMEMVSQHTSSSASALRSLPTPVDISKSSVSASSSSSGALSGLTGAGRSSSASPFTTDTGFSNPTTSSKVSKKIKLMSSGAGQDYHHVSINPPLGGPDTSGGDSANKTRYIASTTKIKNLDAQERKILRKRMNNLAATSSSPDNGVPAPAAVAGPAPATSVPAIFTGGFDV